MSVKMRVGGFYRQRNGKVDEIISRDDHFRYPWNGKSGTSYTDEGFEYGSEYLSDNDLMEEINPPSEPVELTDMEIEDHWWGELDNRSLSAIRRIIAADRAKRGVK